MSLRTYAGLLTLEDIYDYIPTDNQNVVNLANQIFSPNLQIIEADCGTTLGYYKTVNYDIQGDIELSTDEAIDKDRVDQLLFNGTYYVAIRSARTCISSGGICQKCYQGSVPGETASVNDRVTLSPEYLISTDVIPVDSSSSTYTLSLTTTQYTNAYVYLDSTLLTSGYSISGTTFTFSSTPTESTNLVVKYTSYNRAPFLMYLARSYSGSLLGMKPLPSEILPVRSLLLTELLDTNTLSQLETTVVNTSVIPSDLSGYIENIVDPLEKGLYMLVLISMYNGVSN